MNDEEIWKDILDYDGYQVSNEGQVRSLDRVDSLGHHIKGKILKPFINKDGYQRVRLCKNGKQKNFSVHRLVYAAFCGEIPPGMQVNHIDECKTNNRLENLNLMTSKENCNWGTRNERHAKARLNGKMAKPVVGCDKDGNVVVTFPSVAEAGRNGYNFAHISSCCLGRKHYNRYKGLYWKYKDDENC